MRKSTYESRMRLYIAALITIGILVIMATMMYQTDTTTMYVNATIDINEIHNEVQPVELMEIGVIQPLDNLPEKLTEVAQITPPNPDDYDGKIIIATADEVITMTIDDDNIKHFTNHFVA